MNVKQLVLKSVAPVTVGAIVLASGVLSTLAGFIVTPTTPSNCVAGYGYQAGYGYGYGYDTATCTVSTVAPIMGGGSSSSYASTPLPTPTTGSWDGDIDVDTDTPIEVNKGTWVAESIDGDTCNAASATYNDESKSAYLFACVNNITTKRDIDNSVFYGTLIRKEMAKMISNYAMNVMNMEPDTSKSCTFLDIVGESDEMKKYITLSCQLGLMGYESDGKTQAPRFNPNVGVTRAMFATLFSRMIYGDTYNSTTVDSINWAGAHLNALKADDILKNINPSLTEVRGYVWIVFDRASNQ